MILRGLAEEPRARYPSVREFVQAVERHLNPQPRTKPGVRLAAIGVLLFLIMAAGMRAMVVGFGSGKEIPDLPASERPVPAAGPLDARSQLLPPGKTQAAAAHPPERSAEFKRLTELRAYRIWDEEGRPRGKAGEAVKEKNWNEAEKQIESEVKTRAYKIWEQQGRPTGLEGDAVREKNLLRRGTSTAPGNRGGISSPTDTLRHSLSPGSQPSD